MFVIGRGKTTTTKSLKRRRKTRELVFVFFFPLIIETLKRFLLFFLSFQILKSYYESISRKAFFVFCFFYGALLVTVTTKVIFSMFEWWGWVFKINGLDFCLLRCLFLTCGKVQVSLSGFSKECRYIFLLVASCQNLILLNL